MTKILLDLGSEEELVVVVKSKKPHGQAVSEAAVQLGCEFKEIDAADPHDYRDLEAQPRLDEKWNAYQAARMVFLEMGGAVPSLEDIEGREGSLKILFFGDGRGDLPGVRMEFHAVVETLEPLRERGYLHARFLLGEALTKANLEVRVMETRHTIFYYAGHIKDDGHTLPIADSDLAVQDFLEITNRNPPTLLMMNACKSLGCRTKDLASIIYLNSGALFVIGTSWLVRDDVPAGVFPSFFKGLMQGRPIADSFNMALEKHPIGGEQYSILGDPSYVL